MKKWRHSMIVIELNEIMNSESKRPVVIAAAWEALQIALQKYADLSKCKLGILIETVAVEGGGYLYKRFFNLESDGQKLLLLNRGIHHIIDGADMNDDDDCDDTCG